MKTIAKWVLLGSCGFSAINVGADAGTFAVSFAVVGVRSEAGVLKSVLCTNRDNFPSDCRIRKEVKAAQGVVNIEFNDVPAGEYAFAVFHDENVNGRVDMSPGFLPMEGMAFGKDAMGRTGVPVFAQSAITVRDSSRNVVKMRYLKY